MQPKHALPFALAAALMAGCESTAPTTQSAADGATDPATTTAVVATPAATAAPEPLMPPGGRPMASLPDVSKGSILDRSGWARTTYEVPSVAVQHFPVLFRDFETKTERDARLSSDRNATSDQQTDRIMAIGPAGNWNRTNAADGFVQPLKHLYDIGVLPFTIPFDLYHGVAQTPDPEAEAKRKECEFYP